MGYADLHIHSTYSDGLATPAEILAWAEDHTTLDVIAVTDHDTLEGGLALREAWARGRYRVDVIVGVEITTLEGHLLCYDIEHPLPSWRPLAWTIAQVHAQGGFVVVPHPGSPLTRSVGARGMARRLRDPNPEMHPDGVEILNASMAGRVIYPDVLARNRQWGLAMTGGSDAHILRLIGTASTRFAGARADDLRRALRARETAFDGRFWGWQDYRSMTAEVGPILWRAFSAGSFQQLRGLFLEGRERV